MFLRLSDGSLAIYRSFAASGQIVRFAKLPVDMPLLWNTSPGMQLHRFDGLVTADAGARSRVYR